jgi:hypothetical protein
VYYLLYILYFIPAMLVTWLCWITNPIACLFTVRTLGRDNLIPFFYLWQTFDHEVDWGWYGNYDLFTNKTQDDYDNSWLLRYLCRVWWLSRNTAYGWHLKLFSVAQDKGFQIKGKTRAIFGFYNDYNFGWKSHDGEPRKMFAGRILGIRKVK